MEDLNRRAHKHTHTNLAHMVAESCLCVSVGVVLPQIKWYGLVLDLRNLTTFLPNALHPHNLNAKCSTYQIYASYSTAPPTRTRTIHGGSAENGRTHSNNDAHQPASKKTPSRLNRALSFNRYTTSYTHSIHTVGGNRPPQTAPQIVRFFSFHCFSFLFHLHDAYGAQKNDGHGRMMVDGVMKKMILECSMHNREYRTTYVLLQSHQKRNESVWRLFLFQGEYHFISAYITTTINKSEVTFVKLSFVGYLNM